jgi:peptide/nickel transport system substrate-binding protein
MRATMTLRYYRRLLALTLSVTLLAGCQLEGGFQGTPTLAPEQSEPAPLSPAPVAGWRIGITDEPADLFPYSDQREAGPLLMLLYPPPLLAFGDGYRAGEILQELPTFENGGVVSETVQVNLDATGAITTTATGVTTEAVQIVVTYRWREDLTWSDGAPLTAGDSLYAYELARQSVATSEVARKLDLTARYEALDDHTTRAYLQPARGGLREPDYLLSVWLPLPRHALEDVPPAEVRARLAQEPISYGPYTLQSREPGRIVLARRAGAPASYPERIEFHVLAGLAELRDELLAGRIDVGVTEKVVAEQFPFIEQDQAKEMLQLLSAPGPVWEHLDFNLDLAPFDDPRVRQGIAHALNREAMAAELFGGHAPVFNSWIGPDSWASAEGQLNAYPYDPARARQLLEEAGLVDYDGDGMRELAPGSVFTATLLTSADTPLREELVRRALADLHEVGISLTTELLPVSELYNRAGPLFHREFELALFGSLRMPDPDGAVLWSCAAIPTSQNGWSNNNFAGWCNLDADRVLREATTILDRDQRRAAYVRHQQLFAEALPSIPLLARPVVILAAPGVRGLQPDGFVPITWNLQAWKR